MTTLHDFGGVLGRPLDTCFGLSQLLGHGSWLVCEVALSKVMTFFNKYKHSSLGVVSSNFMVSPLAMTSTRVGRDAF